jgi:heat shock protein HslJ
MKKRIPTFVLAMGAALLAACASNPVAPDATGAEALLGNWDLVLLQDAASGTEYRPEEPGTFVVEFREEGEFGLQADCNRCRGTYEAGADQLSIDPLVACTLAYCQTAPVDTRFVGLLTQAQRYEMAGGFLEITCAEGALLLRRL